eukprot:5584103-Pyramimonas_sp.AAC.1
MTGHRRLGYLPRRVQWDREALMQSLRSGQGRADFLTELETHLRGHSAEWKAIHHDAQTPNAEWGFFTDALLTTGGRHFSEAPECRPV